MKLVACVLAFLLGTWFSASFLGAEHVDIRLPAERLWVLCGYALATAMAFATIEEFIRRVAPGVRYGWLTATIVLLAFFFLGVSVARLAYLSVQSEAASIDAVAVGFFLGSFFLAIGVALPKIVMAVFKIRRARKKGA
ncbi:hypothetical protein [Lysobacter sp. Root983]|uniref:hypothetical protein n=1 Tax=Lysobacter sp. Root983 TaxID=1736613 RepID=UPI00070A3D1C|nr:hypothetical protein [Lysobacter sp. Root983]KRD76018.1 hypothetical protein ASE43_14505 [Lysobacter sp. Root983]